MHTVSHNRALSIAKGIGIILMVVGHSMSSILAPFHLLVPHALVLLCIRIFVQGQVFGEQVPLSEA